jgi:hypothetical protein
MAMVSGLERDVFRQCLLKKENKHITCWIPAKLAKIGKKLKIKMGGSWDKTWTVDKTFEIVSAEQLENLSEQYYHARQVTDI